MTLTVSANQVVAIEKHLKKPGALVSLILSSGSVLTVGQMLEHDVARMSFYDFAGDTVVVGIGEIEAYILAAEAPGNGEPDGIVEAGMSAPLGDAFGIWQAAFMELRAACDESTDPKVREAVANLEAVELELEARGDDEQGPASS